MDIRPEIEIDTENYEEAQRLIMELDKQFWGLLNKEVIRPRPSLEAKEKAQEEMILDHYDDSSMSNT